MKESVQILRGKGTHLRLYLLSKEVEMVDVVVQTDSNLPVLLLKLLGAQS